jgi:hypothetical protein
MGFRPSIPEQIRPTERPTTDEIRLIRQEIDPNGILLVA